MPVDDEPTEMEEDEPTEADNENFDDFDTIGFHKQGNVARALFPQHSSIIDERLKCMAEATAWRQHNGFLYETPMRQPPAVAAAAWLHFAVPIEIDKM